MSQSSVRSSCSLPLTSTQPSPLHITHSSISKMCEWYQVEFNVPKKDSQTNEQKKDKEYEERTEDCDNCNGTGVN